MTSFDGDFRMAFSLVETEVPPTTQMAKHTDLQHLRFKTEVLSVSNAHIVRLACLARISEARPKHTNHSGSGSRNNHLNSQYAR